MWTSLFLVVSGISAASMLIFDDPCYVMPNPGPWQRNSTMNVTIPSQCKNGTSDWNYPRGHLMLLFDNILEIETNICIRDNLGGTVFKITDMISGEPLGEFDEKTWACTESTTARVIRLQVDAPSADRYMGAFDFIIHHRII